MRIFSEHTEPYIQSLAAAINKDPSSLEHWRCLHLAQKEDTSFTWFEAMLQKLKEAHSDADCDMVYCTDNDVLFISRHMQADQLLDMAGEWIHTVSDQAGEKADIALYDLFHDWRTVRNLLLAKAGEPSPPVTPPALHNFGEISSLQDVFAEAKQLRKVRMPLHVMLVEDDPLTRRLITGTFKEQYALITAASAEEAVANYLLHAPDIVFLDIGLPDTSGFEVLHRILKSDPEAYVVMFSGNSYLDNITAALSTGAAGFVAKPFKKEKMQHYIHDSALHHHKYAG